MRKDKSLQKHAEGDLFTVIAQASDTLELKSAVDSFLFRTIDSRDKSLRKIQESIKKGFDNPKILEDEKEEKRFSEEFNKNIGKYSEITAVENGLYLKFSIHQGDRKHVSYYSLGIMHL